jgi:hypothetical protein
MNLQPIKPPMRTGQLVPCCVCYCLTAFPLADMDGEPFAAYYCPTCAEKVKP